MITYSVPEGVEAAYIMRRPVLTTPQGGRVALDPRLLDFWTQAAGKTLPDIIDHTSGSETDQQLISAAVGCLVEAGLLSRGELGTVSNHGQHHAGKVSIIIVSHNSRSWLEGCLPSIWSQNYSAIEVIILENGLEDDSEWLRDAFPQVKYFHLGDQVPFARAINIGVENASGDYLLLLNPDTSLSPNALVEMVSVIQDRPECAAVASKLRLMWTPAFLNGIGNRVGSFSFGTDNGLGHLDLGQFDAWSELPSVCFAAALISRAAWDQIGPLDEGFRMYYEDSEWSYRARYLGYKLYPAPRAVVYHAFTGYLPDRSTAGMAAEKLQNVVYGRLRFALKLLDEYLPLFLFSYIFEDGLNIARFFFTLRWRMALSILRGWLNFLMDLRQISQLRKRFRKRKTMTDPRLFRLQRMMPASNMWHGIPELTWDLIRSQYLPLFLQGRTRKMPEFEKMDSRSKLLIISHDIVDEKMAGPGMRYLEMSSALSDDLQVTLAVPSKTSLTRPGVSLVHYDPRRSQTLENLCLDQDFILVSSYLVDKHPFLRSAQARLVVDLYDPFVLENLHYYQDESMDSQLALNDQSVQLTNRLARIGDYFICGNERQRDFWMGVLTANGRVNPLNYQHDPSLRDLIDVVGIGYPDREPERGPLYRGIHPLVPQDALLVLWGGGVWNWLDPLTLIKAWPAVVEALPQARLVILGTRHPNPDIPRHKMARDAQDLASEIGEKDKTILFVEWLSYQERESLLSEADVGVVLHPMHVETRYSIRTRVVDYLWARLPVVITDGDITSSWIRDYKIGAVVPPFDEQAVSAALLEILKKPKGSWSAAFEELDEKFSWSQVVSPLREYCLSGSHAVDRKVSPGSQVNNRSASSWASKFARARFIRHNEGWRGLIHRTWRYLQWRLSIPS